MIEISDLEFKRMSELIKGNYGINLGEGKRLLLVGRLQKLLSEKGFSDFSEYYRYILADKTGAALSELADLMTTNHTFFMREPEHLHYFRDTLLPYLLSSVTSKDLYIWSAGCSRGEEPYTLAIIIDQVMGFQKSLWNTRILATDISSSVLAWAQRGIYPKNEISALPKYWQKVYFTDVGGEQASISEYIRSDVIFRRLNLMDESFPFKKKMHVVFCKNVMIYFDMPTKINLVKRFAEIMPPGGFLFIGLSETINWENSGFVSVAPSIYRRI